MCVLEKIDKSVIYTALFHDLFITGIEYPFLIFTFEILHGSGAGYLEQRCLE